MTKYSSASQRSAKSLIKKFPFPLGQRKEGAHKTARTNYLPLWPQVESSASPKTKCTKRTWRKETNTGHSNLRLWRRAVENLWFGNTGGGVWVFFSLSLSLLPSIFFFFLFLSLSPCVRACAHLCGPVFLLEVGFPSICLCFSWHSLLCRLYFRSVLAWLVWTALLFNAKPFIAQMNIVQRMKMFSNLGMGTSVILNSFLSSWCSMMLHEEKIETFPLRVR